MTNDASGNAQQFAAVRAFVRAYLNQDYEDEYGTPAAAARAFCEDASEEERKRVAEEWRAFVESVAGLGVDEVNARLVGELGSGWSIRDVRELKRVTLALEKSAK
jgi:hypothetical protein